MKIILKLDLKWKFTLEFPICKQSASTFNQVLVGWHKQGWASDCNHRCQCGVPVLNDCMTPFLEGIG